MQAVISLPSKHFANKSAALKLGRPIQGTFHNIKAKAISDYEGSSKEKQLFNGHKTESQVVTYDREVMLSPTLDVPPLAKGD
ncbi:TPA: integrase [Salmonella enterica subsp. salamae]|nr:integrase [Salmonella enterica]EAA5900694.1 integrase [Salmonella enterica subsp. enterica]ECJ2427099.1 integrase [Salmonella enterica subsp. salamae]EDW0466578.1 integrase [Salmonella enterica subsp. enterica serovar Victoria]EAR9310199.1 integrase [Salmonella enterica]EAW1761887.1 integrase [Salmonella enterica subsp. enterica]